MRTGIEFKPNTQFEYQVLLTKTTWSVLMMPGSQLSVNWETRFPALECEKNDNQWDSGMGFGVRQFSSDSREPSNIALHTNPSTDPYCVCKASRNKNEDNPSSDGMIGHEYFTIGNNWILIHRRIDIF